MVCNYAISKNQFFQVIPEPVPIQAPAADILDQGNVDRLLGQFIKFGGLQGLHIRIRYVVPIQASVDILEQGNVDS